jgi:hypothetical protein
VRTGRPSLPLVRCTCCTPVLALALMWVCGIGARALARDRGDGRDPGIWRCGGGRRGVAGTPGVNSAEMQSICSQRPRWMHPGEAVARVFCSDNQKIEWSGREDLNLRPPGPQPGAASPRAMSPCTIHCHEARHDAPSRQWRTALHVRRCHGLASRTQSMLESATHLPTGAPRTRPMACHCKSRVGSLHQASGS